MNEDATNLEMGIKYYTEAHNGINPAENYSTAKSYLSRVPEESPCWEEARNYIFVIEAKQRPRFVA